MAALLAVRRRIAQAIIGGAAPVEAQLGGITLRPHQRDAVHRLLEALHAHGGALLADAPGLGKTFVALAVARAFQGVLVVAPAALRAQWAHAATQAGVRIAWCSLETLSRRPLRHDAALLVVDEAHHLRNRASRRYAHAAALAIGKRVLLLSATPVHNRTDDRDALFALFLGARAVALPVRVAAQLIVRRDADRALLPRRATTRWLRPASTPHILERLRALPPPLPAADGRQAAALIRLTLAHAWSSSIAALDATARRAAYRAGAIDDALAAERWPTRRELRSWVTGDDASQLAFPELVATSATGNIAGARATLTRYLSALGALRTETARVRDEDGEARAELLRRVLHAHRDATIVAFSRYAATVDALWRALRFERGIVAITARGVRSAGGGLRRSDVLAALASATVTDARTPLRLVISTDLLGEGLDLRAASVIVHLDQPWTPALLDQREGRALRLTSTHAAVHVYAVHPPPGARRMLTMASRLRRKRDAMRAGTAGGSAREELLAHVRPWLSDTAGSARTACAVAHDDGWAAVVGDAGGRRRVIAAARDGIIREDDAAVLALLRTIAGASPATLHARRVAEVRRAIRRWLRADTSAHLAGRPDPEAAARAAVSRRLDDALRAVPLHRRAECQPRIAAARVRVAGLHGAGVERALAVAAKCATVDELLSAMESLGESGGVRSEARFVAHGTTPNGALNEAQHPRLHALLVLVAGP